MKKLTIVTCIMIIVCPFVVVAYNIYDAIANDRCLMLTIVDLIRNNKAFFPALMTIAVALFGYFRYIDTAQSKELDNFNKRFLSEEMVNSTIHKDLMKGDIVPFDQLSEEYLNKREQFMRFYEELQFSIDSGRLNKKQTHYMFGYYAGEVFKYDDKFVKDFYAPCWKTFRRFAAYDYVQNNIQGRWNRLIHLLCLKMNGYKRII